MNALVGLILGLILKLIATSLYDATSAEGLIVYLIGFIAGYLLIKEVRNER